MAASTPNQQDSIRAEFAETCYGAILRLPGMIDDLIQTGKVSRKRFVDCVGKVEHGEFPVEHFEMQRLYICVSRPA